MYHRGKGRRLMILVNSLIWELSNVEVTREVKGSGESESIHRDEREQSEVNVRIQAPETPPRTRPVLGKNRWLPELPEKSIWRHIVLIPEFQIALSGGMHQW